MSTISNPQDLLGLHPSSEILSTYIAFLFHSISSSSLVAPDIKSYPDAVYLNYFSLGTSLLFAPLSPYKPPPTLKLSELDDDKLALESIDIYNIPKPMSSDSRTKGTSSKKAELAFSTFPITPFKLTLTGQSSPNPSPQFEVHRESTGKDFVQGLGEPDRKGGGAGPSSGSIGIWCEWSKHGIMIEFGGDEAKGPQAWERGKDAVWKVITMFRPNP